MPLPRHDILAHVAAAIRRAIPGVMAIYVYGSAARGDDRSDSDVDIAVLLPPGQRLANRLMLIAELHDVTGRSVDVVDLRQVGTFLRMEVLRDGRQIANSDPGQVLAWEGYAMSEYTQHRAAIRDIMSDFRRTGIGYHQ